MKSHLGPLAILALLILYPWVMRDPYYQHLMILVLLWVAIGSGWNLLAGFTGQVSFGHAAFFGSGAYTSALLAEKLGMSAWWGLAFGGLVAVAASGRNSSLVAPLRFATCRTNSTTALDGYHSGCAAHTSHW